MLMNTLLVMHIAVLGYWLGSELVINSTYRYVSWSRDMPFAERNRLMDHVMDVDQHVRYALILQLGLGTALAGLLGYLPGGRSLVLVAAATAVAWLALVEAAHRQRRSDTGAMLARIDRVIRYAAIAGLLLLGGAALAGAVSLPAWLAWKLMLFAGVIACGLGIRVHLIRFYVIWQQIRSQGSDNALEQAIRRTYVAATATLALLWVLIGGIVFLSLVRF